MMNHNLCFKGELWKIVPKYLFYPFLSGALYIELRCLSLMQTGVDNFFFQSSLGYFKHKELNIHNG